MPSGALIVGVLTVSAQLWIARRTRTQQRADFVADQRAEAYQGMIEVLLRRPEQPTSAAPAFVLDRFIEWAEELDRWVSDFKVSQAALYAHADAKVFETFSSLPDRLRKDIRGIQVDISQARELRNSVRNSVPVDEDARIYSQEDLDYILTRVKRIRPRFERILALCNELLAVLREEVASTYSPSVESRRRR